MTHDKTGGPAFPGRKNDPDRVSVTATMPGVMAKCDESFEPGLTVRQWYAGMALQGILAKDGGSYFSHKTEEGVVVFGGIQAEEAFRQADAMIEFEHHDRT